jgi:predicted amidohydrolase
LENRAFVIGPDGSVLGHQTKDQITPGGESRNYVPEGTRRMFEIKGVPFGVVICHEGWRYPETVRWAAVRGAKIVFQPQVTGGNQNRPARPQTWGDSYYEKAMILRSKENSIYFASVNETMARQNSATSLIDPEGNLVAHIPYGEEGLLVADLDLAKATGFYASRYRPEFYPQDHRPVMPATEAVGATGSDR